MSLSADLSGIDEIDAGVLAQVLTPYGVGLSTVDGNSAGAGLSASSGQSELKSPALPVEPSSSSDEGLLSDDNDDDVADNRSIHCGSPHSDPSSNFELDVEIGVDSGVDMEIDDGEEHKLVGEREWLPGRNCGRWIDQQTPLAEQACILITNACLVASRLPSKLLCAAVDHLGRKKSWGSYVWHLISSLFCISISTVRQVMKGVQRNSTMWNPCIRKPAGAGLSAPDDSHTGSSTPQFLSTVRIAIANAAEGRSALAYERDVLRFRCAGWEFNGPGGSKFAQEVAGLAVMVLAQMDAFDFDELLPGLGIPSDFCLLADPVSIGESAVARHGDLLVMCLAIVSARTGRVYHPMFSAPQMKIGEHGGQKCAEAMLRACLAHPAAWTVQVLRARVGGIGGDGALTVGGPNARHNSSGAAEYLWKSIHNTNAPALPRAAGSSAPTCTSWDPFHRVDVAMWRSVRKHALVLSIFDMSKEVDHLFGQSEGTLIFRGVASELGETPCNVRAPGGTRKVVYLSGVPGSLLQNYKVIRGGLHARVAWKQAGHSSQKLYHLLELGRRMSEPHFCITLTLLEDILGGLLQPFARQVQEHMEASVFHQKQTQVMRKIELYVLSIHRLRVLMRVISLCRQHLTSTEAVKLCMALGGVSPCTGSFRPNKERKTFRETHHGVSHATWQIILRERSKTGQFGIEPLRWGSVATHFPTFFKHVAGLLADRPTFQGCEVVMPSKFNHSTHVFLGAHCQCMYRERDLLQQWDAHIASHTYTRPKGPLWVAYQQVGMSAQGVGLSTPADLVAIPPRCVTLPKLRRKPPQHISEGMFRHTIPKCSISHRDFLMDEALDTALQGISDFLVTMKEEVHDILGSIGVNDSMSTLLAHAHKCWDWQQLAFERPTAAQVRAFRSAATELEPLLKNTQFPALPGFEKVPRYWKSVNDLCIEYVILCERVRRAMATQCRTARGFRLTHSQLVPDEVAFMAKSWVKRATCAVSPIYATPHILCSLYMKLRRLPGSTDVFLLRCLGRVSYFLSACSEGLFCLPAGAGSAAQLRQWTRRSATAPGQGVYNEAMTAIQDRSRKKCTGKRSGLHNIHKGNVVQWSSICAEVVRVEQSVDVAQVTLTIGMHKWFAVGATSSERCAWGGGRLLHRCRVLMSPDASCEAIGSWMRYTWNPRRHMTPTDVADAVFLAQAGVRCIGGQRDEFLVAEVAQLLQETCSRRGKQGSTLALQQRLIEEHDQWVRASGRSSCENWLTPDVEQASPPIINAEGLLSGVKTQGARRSWLLNTRRHRHSDLPAEMTGALKQSIQSGGRMAVLQMDVQHLHAPQRGVTSSVMHQRMCSWIDSEAGKAWKMERALLLQVDDKTS